MAQTDTVISIEGLTKVYEDSGVPVHALNGVDLTLKTGEFTAIVGPSGSGKTTLLNIVGGLDTPTSGRVVVAGTDLSNLSRSQLTHFRLHTIGFVFQSYNLIPVLTAGENTEFVMQLQGRDKDARNRRGHELLERVGLGDRLDSRPNQLSGGQQQRVAVARALASRPQFVLADEPTASLGSHATANLLDIMSELNRAEQVTFVFSTHDQRVIDRARRVVVLEDGHIVEDRGRP